MEEFFRDPDAPPDPTPEVLIVPREVQDFRVIGIYDSPLAFPVGSIEESKALSIIYGFRYRYGPDNVAFGAPYNDIGVPDTSVMVAYLREGTKRRSRVRAVGAFIGELLTGKVGDKHSAQIREGLASIAEPVEDEQT